MTTTFADNLRFLRALITRPKNIGAVLPSGPALANAMARQITAHGSGPGAGTRDRRDHGRDPGHGTPPESLTCVEYDGDFARHLRARFPRVNIVQGDAFDLDKTLAAPHQPFAAILSGLPLLNFPVAARRRLIDGALARLAPGGVLRAVLLWPACAGGAAGWLGRHPRRHGLGQRPARPRLGLPPHHLNCCTLCCSKRCSITILAAPGLGQAATSWRAI